MLQYLDLLAICHLSPSFKPQLQRYTGEVDPVNHLTLSWILVLIRACAVGLGVVDAVDARREVPFLIGYDLTVTDWDSFQERSSFNTRIRELLHQTLPIKVINLEDTRDEECNTYRLGSKDLSLYFITNTVDCLRDDDDDIYRLGEMWRRSYIKNGVLMVVAMEYEGDGSDGSEYEVGGDDA